MALGAAAGTAAAAACLTSHAATAARLRVAISYPASAGVTSIDGRMLLLLSTDGRQEPRLQITDNDRTQQAFGVDVTGLKPGQDAVFDEAVLGYPAASLADVRPGEYFVQGLLHVYETFARSDGHTVSLPPDRGEFLFRNKGSSRLQARRHRRKGFQPYASTNERLDGS